MATSHHLQWFLGKKNKVYLLFPLFLHHMSDWDPRLWSSFSENVDFMTFYPENFNSLRLSAIKNDKSAYLRCADDDSRLWSAFLMTLHIKLSKRVIIYSLDVLLSIWNSLLFNNPGYNAKRWVSYSCFKSRKFLWLYEMYAKYDPLTEQSLIFKLPLFSCVIIQRQG